MNIFFLFLMGQSRPLFRLFSVFFKQTLLQFLQQIDVKNVMSIQYTALGFKPTTFGRESPLIITRPGLPWWSVGELN